MKRDVFTYGIKEVAPFIDWSYFLHAWGIARESAQAVEIIAEAKALLNALDGRYRTTAIFALCDAKGDGDNIIIEGTTLPLLRQQHNSEGRYNLCLSDFVSPHDDKIGLFATSVESEFGKEYAGDEYKNLLAQTLADRHFYPAKAYTQNGKVIVSSPHVAHPIAVRYGWADNPECNLYTPSGFIVAPFRSDNW